MQYTVRFVNGYWRLLDLDEYREVGMFGLQKLADAACAEANAEPLGKKPA